MKGAFDAIRNCLDSPSARLEFSRFRGVGQKLWTEDRDNDTVSSSDDSSYSSELESESEESEDSEYTEGSVINPDYFADTGLCPWFYVESEAYKASEMDVKELTSGAHVAVQRMLKLRKNRNRALQQLTVAVKHAQTRFLSRAAPLCDVLLKELDFEAKRIQTIVDEVGYFPPNALVRVDTEYNFGNVELPEDIMLNITTWFSNDDMETLARISRRLNFLFKTSGNNAFLISELIYFTTRKRSVSSDSSSDASDAPPDWSGCRESSDSDNDGKESKRVATVLSDSSSDASDAPPGRSGCRESSDSDNDGKESKRVATVEELQKFPNDRDLDGSGCRESSDSDNDGKESKRIATVEELQKFPNDRDLDGSGHRESSNSDNDGTESNRVATVEELQKFPNGRDLDGSGCRESSDSDNDGKESKRVATVEES